MSHMLPLFTGKFAILRALLVAAGGSALARGDPVKPIRLVSPCGSGDAADITSAADRLKPRCGMVQPVIVGTGAGGDVEFDREHLQGSPNDGRRVSGGGGLCYTERCRVRPLGGGWVQLALVRRQRPA